MTTPRLSAAEQAQLLQRLQLAQNTIQFGMWGQEDLAGAEIWGDEIFRRICRLPETGPIQRQALEARMPPEDYIQVSRLASEAKVGEPVQFRYRMQFEDEYRWIEAWGLLIEKDGKPQWVGVLRDITAEASAGQELQRLVAQLQEKEEMVAAQAEELEAQNAELVEHITEIQQLMQRMEMGFQMTNLGFSLIDLDTSEFVNTNEAYRQMCFDDGELTSLEELRSRMNEGKGELLQAFERLVVSGDPQQVRYSLRVNNEQRWIEANITLLELHGQRLLQGFNRDITAEVQQQREREQLLRRLQVAVESTGLGFFVFYPESGEYLSTNAEYRRTHFEGAEPESFHQVLARMTNPEDAQQAMADSLAQGKNGYVRYGLRLRGELRWIDAWGRMFVENGQPIAYAYSRDVTAEVQAQQQQERMQQQLNLLLEAIEFGYEVIDLASGQYQETNEVFRKGHWEIDNEPFESVMARIENRKEVELTIARGVQTGKPDDVVYRIRHHGELRWVHAWGVAQHEDSGPKVYAFTKDITAEVQAQAEEEHILRLSTLGEASASLAHELKSPISALLMNLDFIERPEASAEKRQKAIANIRKTAVKMRQRLQHLQDFSRQRASTENWGYAQLEEIWSGVMILSEHQLHQEGVALQVELEADLPRLLCHPMQLEQALVNLLNNARDAMADRETKQLNVRAWREDQHLCLSLQDTGTGMDEETRQHLFDKFFTTKSAGRGTGLGMNIVRKILEEHGGTIEVESELDVGTTMTVRLPLTAPKPER